MIDQPLYQGSLIAAISLMTFFSMTFLFGRLPHGKGFHSYGKARRRFGMALLVLIVNYAVHLFAEPRAVHHNLAILINIDTYFLAVWFFGSSMQELLTRGYNSLRRDIQNVISWLIYCTIGIVLMLVFTDEKAQTVVLLVLSLVFMLYCLYLAVHLIRAYKRAVRLLNDYYSDNIAAYVRWVSVFTWLAAFYGVGQGIFTHIPGEYVYIWILSSIPFYTYGYLSYTNYALDVLQVNEAINYDSEENAAPEHSTAASAQQDPTGNNTFDESTEKKVSDGLADWVEKRRFTQQGVTIVQLAKELDTNHTYISVYINTHFGYSFRDWVNQLRLDYAKQMLLHESETSIDDIAYRAGYPTPSSFSRAFAANEGISPSQWRKMPVD